MLKPVAALCLLCFTCSALATVQCGPFIIEMTRPDVFFVNSAKATKVRTTFTGKAGDRSNVTYRWLVKNTRAPGILAMEHRYEHGKPVLKVDVVPTRSQPIRISGDYDCKTQN